jgi:hypothetical protein
MSTTAYNSSSFATHRPVLISGLCAMSFTCFGAVSLYLSTSAILKLGQMQNSIKATLLGSLVVYLGLQDFN